MQSSGLLSYVNDKELKTGLSYYYEVIFKKLNDNNKLFDDVGINYLDKYLTFNHGAGIRKWEPDMHKQLSPENGFTDIKEYRKFLLGLKSTKAILTSDDFVYATNVYITRYFGYQRILSVVKANNHKLIQQLKAQLEH
jgi:hypothetical protein